MAESAARKILQEFANDESLKNKTCVDCGAPRPQWASISFAILFCLQCAGTHRGFGVHISFVRSISMDTWQEEQLRRMKLGGNAPFMAFLREYPSDHSGYIENMSTHDKYHCWAATQYREKLTAALEGKAWSPSPPPPSQESNSVDAPGRPSSAQGLRKSRASTRSPSSNLRQTSNSPAPSPLSQSLEFSNDHNAANESYFASLGASNAARPDHLPPSQGGRYTGFGSTPSPGPPEHLSSAAAPTLSELQSDPVRALSKGWSLFASAVADASRTVSENVVKPGMERVADPELRGKVGGYVNSASRRAAAAAETANAWGRTQFGVDVGESVGAVVEKVRSGVSGGPHGQGYEAVDQWGEEDEGSGRKVDDDFYTTTSREWENMETLNKSQPGESKPETEDWSVWKSDGRWREDMQTPDKTQPEAAKTEPRPETEDWNDWKAF